MNKITKAWTYGVAYVSLAVGSGVSIAGNIADTYRTVEAAGRTVDALDIVLSAFWPAAVLLAIEMFVSTLWPRTVPMQLVRWVGSLGIGFLAMYASWHHLADLMGSRGQDAIVARTGPLAIDGLAIMATGLILSSRGHKIVKDIAEKAVTISDVRNQHYREIVKEEAVRLLTPDAAPATQPMDPAWTAEDEAMLADWDRNYGATAPVSPAPALARSNEVKPESVPDSAKTLFWAWDSTKKGTRPVAKDMHELVAAAHDVSPRTARRWYDAITKVKS
jgi:hypothetical protein